MKHQGIWCRLGSYRHMLVAVAALLLTIQANSSHAEAPNFKTSDQKMLYLWGATIGNELAVTGVTDAKELDWITRGLRDRVAGKSPAVATEEQSQLHDYLMNRLKETADAEAELSLAYLGKKAKEPNAVVTESGLVYRELKAGEGAQPTKDSTVTVQYTGSLRNGWVFDSSRQRGTPIETGLTEVISCWSEALLMMKVGGKATLTCPPDLAYGDGGTLTIPPGSVLTFDLELLDVSGQKETDGPSP